MADVTWAGSCGTGGCGVDGSEEDSRPRMDATRAGNYGVDGVEEDSGLRVDIITSTYIG